MSPKHKTLERLELLIRDYFADVTLVQTLTEINEVAVLDEEVDSLSPLLANRRLTIWGNIAQNLRVPVDYLIGYWRSLEKEDKSRIWFEVLDRRIQNLTAHKTFQENASQRVTGKALAKLELLLDADRIKSPGELLAIARLRATPTGGTVINFGARLDEGQALPGNEEVIMLNLSPRAAANLERPKAEQATRIIDAEMVKVADLRTLSSNPVTGGDEDGEVDGAVG